MMKHELDISIIMLTRGRTTMLERSIKSLVDLADDISKVQILLGFDNDDQVGTEYFSEHLQPWLDERDVAYSALSFEPLGYPRLNLYVNELAKNSSAEWLAFWNDDAVMQTQGWDTEIKKYNSQFKLLAVHTHHDHPYSIFPIAPYKWYEVMGYLSPHPISDAWLSQTAYMLDIWERIPVDVLHDRFDLTGNNNDRTFKEGGPANQPEGNPNNPGDFHHISWQQRRMADTDKLAAYLKAQGIDTSFWENVKLGKQDPWEKLAANDINKQMVQFSMQVPSGVAIIPVSQGATDNA